MGPAWSDIDLVCDRGDGTPFHPDSFTKAAKQLIVNAGLDPKTRLHDLRHGVATVMLEQGVHPAVASAVLGHSSVAFTMDTYQHVIDHMTDQAATALDNAFATGTDDEYSPTQRTAVLSEFRWFRPAQCPVSPAGSGGVRSVRWIVCWMLRVCRGRFPGAECMEVRDASQRVRNTVRTRWESLPLHRLTTRSCARSMKPQFKSTLNPD